MANYQNKLSELNVTVPELSNRIKGKINDYTNVEELLATKEDLSAESKSEMVDALPALDQEIIADIEKWYPQRERYAKQAKHLKPRTPKNKSVEPAAITPPEVKEEVDPPATSDPILESAVIEKPAEVVADPEPEKKKNGFGWLLLGLAVAVITVGAVNTFNKD